MTTAVHGGFDQVLEIAASYVIDQARQKLTLPAASINVDSPTQQLSGTIQVSLRDIWLATPAEMFSATTGAWEPVGVRTRLPRLVVGIELNSDKPAGTGILVKKITTKVNGTDVTLPIPDASQFLDLHAGVLVSLPVVGERLHVRPTAVAAFPADPVPCVALVLNPFDPARVNVPGVGVYIVFDDKRLRASPLVTYLVGLATAAKLDPEQAVMRPLFDELWKQITVVVNEALHGLTDWQVQENGSGPVVNGIQPNRLLLYAATDPMVTAAEPLVDPESLRVLLTLGGKGGDPALITDSMLQSGDALGICVNGTSLLRDVIRGVLEGIFIGLDDGDFVKTEPCTVNKRVLVTLGPGKDAQEAVLVYLQAGINESEDLVLWFQIEVEWALTKALVEVEVPITLKVQRALTGSSQALSIETRIGTADYAVLAETWIPLWGQFVQGIVSSGIGGALSGVKAPNPFRQPLPSVTELRVTGYTLHQDDAPRGTRTPPKLRLLGFDFTPDLGMADLTIGTGAPQPPTAARWRDHDMVVRLGSRSYPTTLTVECSIANGSDPGTRIDGVGGTYVRGGRTVRWSMTAEAAIDYLRAGGTMLVEPGTPTEATVLVVNPAPPQAPYLRASRDTVTTNNLAALAHCPLVVDAPIDDPVGTPTKSIFSDTMVHWRDVVPVGGKGDDSLNQGVSVKAGCLLTGAAVEMIDRNDTVLSSAGFGSEATVSGAGASLVADPTGGHSLAVKVHWWFDAYHVCRYRVRYTVTGTTC